MLSGNFYFLYLLVAVVATVVSAYTVKKIIFITRKKKVFDIPDNVRKIHGAQIPSLGGTGIFTGLVIAVGLFANELEGIRYILLSCIILFFTGMYDDIMNMSPLKKLLAQLIASFITICFAHRSIHLPALFSADTQLWVEVGLSTLACTFFINVFNFIDGIDGLACMLSIFYTSIFGWFFALFALPQEAFWAFGLVGATAGLLVYNYPPARIYMGDTGSMVLGFCIFMLAIQFVNMQVPSGNIIASTFVHKQSHLTLLVIAMFFLPVFDAFRVFALRLAAGRSPMQADRLHLHYYLIDAGFNHNQAAWLLVFTNAITSIVTFLLQDLPLGFILAVIALPTVTVAVVASYMKRSLEGISDL
jgi:UDP-GlcNAc:undecaprenyl-phosphate/decaprenyl-phosphate GlcNAc-1-phosphate transferase